MSKTGEMRYLISSEGTSFTQAKRKEVLDFPLPTTEKALQFIGLVNYFRDHVPKTTELVNYFRDQAPSCTDRHKKIQALEAIELDGGINGSIQFLSSLRSSV